jgi:hypothetical protein
MDAKTVKCTRCGVFDVPAPGSIEEDPVCAQCLREMMYLAADAVMGGHEFDSPGGDEAADRSRMSGADEFEQTIGRIAGIQPCSASDEVYDREKDVDPSHTPGGYAPDGLGSDDDETIQGPQFPRTPRPKIKRRR